MIGRTATNKTKKLIPTFAETTKACTIFISDLHLHESQSLKTDLFLDFLKKIASKADALYILGDLFEFWIGDDDKSKFCQTITTALKDFQVTNKKPIYLMRGNRDFLLGKKFAKKSRCSLAADPTIINLYGTKTLLTHGDIYYANDLLYKFYKKMVTNRVFIKIFLQLPLTVRRKLANTMRGISKVSQKIKPTIRKFSPATITKISQKNDVNLIINGHLHTPKIQKTGSYQQITLGEWNDKGNYLIYYNNNKAKFLTFIR